MGTKKNGEERDERLCDIERDVQQTKDAESDYEPARDSLSSQGETQSNEDAKSKRVSRVPKKLAKKESTESITRGSKNVSSRQSRNKLQYKISNNGKSKFQVPEKATNAPRSNGRKLESTKVRSLPSFEFSEGIDERNIEEVREMDVLDESPNCDHSIGTDDETADADGKVVEEALVNISQKLEEMEAKTEKLEQELREVAALEISLYSVVPEHGSSSHKLHTPARRLSRLYIHASKHWSAEKMATVAKNSISGLVLIAKSCGSDVSRLTFWLSNTVVLREIISQTFGCVTQTIRTAKEFEANGNGKSERRANNFNPKQGKELHILQPTDDWQDTITFTAALKKIESWIFSRVVESVWWQALTPHMQTPAGDLSMPKGRGRFLGPSLSNHQQGDISISIWRSAFYDAFTRLCPLRSGGHECGCLPVLAKMVMEQCVARLDVAMFNAILRESENEIPTDPVSDPIVDPKVLPIPAGNLSFGSGAQLKNSIGNWSRWLTDSFGMDTGDSDDDHEDTNMDNKRRDASDIKSFSLLNELSDLLMLPKDMLLETNVRKEVCPSIGLKLLTRILCNFTPDEFCPDPVPGIVLEDLNSEALLDRLSCNDIISSVPHSAAPVAYHPPSLTDVARKVADTGSKVELDRRASMVQRRGYTSDDDLEALDSPFLSIIGKTTPVSPSVGTNIARVEPLANARYSLLREVWRE